MRFTIFFALLVFRISLAEDIYLRCGNYSAESNDENDVATRTACTAVEGKLVKFGSTRSTAHCTMENEKEKFSEFLDICKSVKLNCWFFTKYYYDVTCEKAKDHAYSPCCFDD